MPARTSRHFTNITDWDSDRITRVLDLTLRLKERARRRRGTTPLVGSHLALLFQKPSLRTRMSFEVGFRQLGGEVTYMSPSEVGLGTREPARDVARVVSRFAQVIVARVFAHQLIDELAEWSAVPVVNALSDFSHPCQIMADLLTVLERRKSLAGLRVAWVGDGNNVATSWIHAACRLPVHVTLACPPGYDPDPVAMEQAAREAPGRVQVTRQPREAVAGADVVYADTWYSMGQEEEMQKRRRDFAGFTIDETLMKAAPDALFMHCLPAHRGDEVTEGVLEGPQSVVFDQAENRLHVQKGILLSVLDCESSAP